MGIYFVIFGVGLGTTISPSTSALMGAVPEANAGVGSAFNDTAGQVGSALGVGILGSVLNSIYSSNVAGAIVGLPDEAAAAAQNFVGGAAQVAANLGGPAGEELRTAANTAFFDGLSVALLASAAIAFVAALLVFRFMPARDLAVNEAIQPKKEE
ncbi:MAG: MFS transporter, partial [Thaumarchaeota archaeon]|nr:MFS transporter [Nitrososphaerota archaeon]